MVWITTLARRHGEIEVRPEGRPDGNHPANRPYTLLIIEDDATTRLALACMLADDRCQIVLARSAEEAMDCLPLVNPDLVLCDYLLEGMNGREFCQEMKTSRRWRYVPVIVVTRMDARSLITDLFRSGADDVLTKPVAGEHLRARVLAGLRTRAQYLDLVAARHPPVTSACLAFDAYA